MSPSTAYALLPAWAQRLYGTLGLPTTALYGNLSARTLRLALSPIPHSLFAGEIYQSAMERAARHTGTATPAAQGPAAQAPARESAAETITA